MATSSSSTTKEPATAKQIGVSSKKVREIFLNYLKSQKLWDRKTTTLDYTDEEIEKKINASLDIMKVADVQSSKEEDMDNFITSIVKTTFCGEILRAMKIDDDHWKKFRVKIAKIAGLFGIKATKDDFAKFQKLIVDTVKESQKPAPPTDSTEQKKATAEDVAKGYAIEVITRTRTDPKSLYNLVFYAYTVLVTAIDQLAVSILPKLEHQISMVVIEARMSLVFPPNMIAEMLKRAETSFKICYDARDTVYVQHDDVFDHDKLDNTVMEFYRIKAEREKKNLGISGRKN
jgi:hypothetical protein